MKKRIFAMLLVLCLSVVSMSALAEETSEEGSMTEEKGDEFDFLYWYEGAQPHIIYVMLPEEEE